jgi:hypothetical protein
MRPWRVPRSSLAGRHAEDLSPAKGWLDQPEQQPDRGGLPGAVGPEIADDLTRVHFQVEVLKADNGAIMLAQMLCPHGRVRFSRACLHSPQASLFIRAVLAAA